MVSDGGDDGANDACDDGGNQGLWIFIMFGHVFDQVWAVSIGQHVLALRGIAREPEVSIFETHDISQVV